MTQNPSKYKNYYATEKSKILLGKSDVINVLAEDTPPPCVRKGKSPPEFNYGKVAFAHTSPFLGILHPVQYIQAVENNMFRARICPHLIVLSDFLLIRTRTSFYVREIDEVFTARQGCPLCKVPGTKFKIGE